MRLSESDAPIDQYTWSYRLYRTGCLEYQAPSVARKLWTMGEMAHFIAFHFLNSDMGDGLMVSFLFSANFRVNADSFIVFPNMPAK